MADEPGARPYGEKKISIHDRRSKVDVSQFPRVPDDFSWYAQYEKLVPRLLKGNDLRALVEGVVAARAAGKPVILMLGAHVVKCGMGPLLGHLVARGAVTGVAMNGACAIHDVELAMYGKTSEDVAHAIEDGSFGMCAETAGFMNAAARRSLEEKTGLGSAVTAMLAEAGPPHAGASLLAACGKAGVGVTVHVAIGTDIVHEHEEADGRAIGHGTMYDFRKFTQWIIGLNGGAVLNIGSAVLMPEVFLKALAIARNRGAKLGEFITADFDMLSQYRPLSNVVQRPRAVGGTGYSFTGHHEILLPVVVAAIASNLR
jgi:hypothetical protein